MATEQTGEITSPGYLHVTIPSTESAHHHINDRPDSIEIGTPSKGGAVKVYFDARDPDNAKRLVNAALQVRAYTADAVAASEKPKAQP